MNEEITNEGPKPVDELKPLCPHCGAENPNLTGRDILYPNGTLALLVFCAECRTIISVSFAGRIQQRPQIQPAAPLIKIN